MEISMIFGSLSEQEVKEISLILDSAGIGYEVIQDQSVLQSNKDSLDFNLRYLFGPNLSNNFLAIKIEDVNLSNLSNDIKVKLSVYGITDEIPDEFINQKFSKIDPIIVDVDSSRKKMVGMTYGLSVLFGVLVIVITYYLKGKPMPW
jgi:hypothetical protein